MVTESVIVVGVSALVGVLVDRDRRARRMLEQVQSLLDLNVLAGTIPDTDLYDKALSSAVAMTHSGVGFFHVVSDDQREIILTTWNKTALQNCLIPSERHYPIEQAGIWVDCVRTRLPTVVNRYQSAPGRKGLPQGHFPLRRFMSVPVIDQDRVKIIFGVGNKRFPYNTRDVQRLQLVATELLRLITRQRVERELRESLSHIQTLHGLIPICAWCKKVRDDEGFWRSVEKYFSDRTDATFTHGICPDCKKKVIHPS